MKRVTMTIISLLAVSATLNVILLFPDDTTYAVRDDDGAYTTFLLSHAVFRGTVVDVRGGPGGGETVTFRVVKVMSQDSFPADRDLDNRDLIDVVSSDRRPDCFLDFEPGMTYIVNSMLENGVIVTDACWGTHPYHRTE